MYKNEFEIDVFRCFRALIKRWRVIAVISALFFVVGFGLTIEPGVDKYTSTAKVYAAAENNYTDATYAVTAMNAYMDVATSYKVCQRAALILGKNDISAEDIQEAIEVASSIKGKTPSSITNYISISATIISFSATTIDPELSREIADAAAESYVIEMENIIKNDSIKILDSAEMGIRSENALSKAWKHRMMYTAMGLVFACLLVVACEVFDKKVCTMREATIKNQLPVIGVIPNYKE